MTFRLSQKLPQLLTDKARRQKMSYSQLIRLVLEREITSTQKRKGDGRLPSRASRKGAKR